MGWPAFLLAYFLGGITFLPLLVLVIFAHAYLTLPRRPDAERSGSSGADGLVQPGDDVELLKAVRKDNAKFRPVHHEQNVAAGYFAVCREYTPMGINAKPIERSTPVGSTTVAAPSPSVYQTMYRSIFDRKQAPGPLDGKNGASQRPKKAGNVFYVVLRHGHLMLFDDEEQLEVRHVVSLAHHDISVYSGEDVTPEGELWIKRNAICLSRRTDGPELGPDTQVSKPFYLFSENCSAKEDFYFALLRNQEETLTAQGRAPTPMRFDVQHMISLVQKLHSSEEHMQTRWLNAMVGRVFLGIHRTHDIENFIRQKLTKKISRVKRPSFLSNISIKAIDTGDAAPYFTNPRLKDLTVEGECGIEADVRYTGNFRLEVAATARIDLGSRFKAREVNMVLAVVLRKLEGHALLRIKPPPSNRIWFSFQQMPKIEMTIEPIVSSRQITYTLILRQIENRIKEVIAETIVLPFWDDTPFFNTEHKKWRGGIFHEEVARPCADRESAAAQEGGLDEAERPEETPAAPDSDVPHLEKSHSAPVLEKKKSVGLLGKKLTHKTSGTELASSSSSATSVEFKPEANPEAKNTTSSPPTIAVPFVQPSSPTVGTIATNAEEFRPASLPSDKGSVISTMATLAGTPLSTSPASPAPVTASNASRPYITSKSSSRSSSTSSQHATDNERDDDKAPQPRRDTISSIESNGEATSATPSLKSSATIRSQAGTISRGLFGRRDTVSSASSVGSQSGTNESTKRNALAAVANAAASAKRWGLNAFQRRNDDSTGRGADGTPTLDLSQPMGRGHPLPPPGTPLPMPERITAISAAHIPKRKPVTPVAVNPPAAAGYKPAEPAKSPVNQQPQPSPHHKRWQIQADSDDPQSTLLVVAAPVVDSEPTTPLGGTHSPGYAASFVVKEAKAASTGTSVDSLAGQEDGPAAPVMNENAGSVAAAAPAAATPGTESSSGSSLSAATEAGAAEGDGNEALPKVTAAAAETAEPVADDTVGDDEDYSAWMDDTAEANGLGTDAGASAGPGGQASPADSEPPAKG
ncbi:hypothetical protein VTJ83DRAFT_1591 [Remersonia thermophila]|uniref:SMP-LTD domain-containing protein n=1 Tax=Remersonia thermophila TaxID=72144 RepID=A0ABR4DGD1_9PEZI